MMLEIEDLRSNSLVALKELACKHGGHTCAIGVSGSSALFNASPDIPFALCCGQVTKLDVHTWLLTYSSYLI